MKSTRMIVPLCLALLALAARNGWGAEPPGGALKIERFDRDPGWEGFNNRIVLKRVPTVTQDFGYSPTNFAGRERGEVGGRVTRSATPAYYAAKIAVKTLNDKLTASGSFAITATSGSSGVFFGWFNAQQPGGGGRPMNSLGLDFDGEGKGARLAVRMVAGTNRACGTFVTPFIPGKFRPTPIRADGTRYTWSLSYDPEANGGNGRFQFTIKSHGTKPEPLAAGSLPADLPERYKKEALSRFPNVTTFAVDVPPEVRKAGATFDHFGLMNLMKAGSTMTIHFDDLQYDGKSEDFSKDPGWIGSGNHATFQDPVQGGAHDFGYSPQTHFAGGAAGEAGGIVWRTEKNHGYYADRVGPLTLDDRLEARGKVVLIMGGPDSDMCLGWFNSADKQSSPARAGNFLGVHVGGPTRVGHYFLPTYTTAQGTRGKVDRGPVLTPGKRYEWSLVYDPAASAGKGSIRVTLGQESVTLDLKEGHKAQGARLDRFGLFSIPPGGQLVRIYVDDLQYTAGRP